MTGVEESIYSDDELAAIDSWSPEPARRQGVGVAGLRRGTAGGALAASVLLGLRDALEPSADDGEAVVIQASDEPEGDRRAPVVVRFDPDSPRATIAFIRR